MLFVQSAARNSTVQAHFIQPLDPQMVIAKLKLEIDPTGDSLCDSLKYNTPSGNIDFDASCATSSKTVYSPSMTHTSTLPEISPRTSPAKPSHNPLGLGRISPKQSSEKDSKRGAGSRRREVSTVSPAALSESVKTINFEELSSKFMTIQQTGEGLSPTRTIATSPRRSVEGLVLPKLGS